MKPSPLFTYLLIAAGLLRGDAMAQSFVVVGIPDTQNYSEFYPAIFNQQTSWIANNLAARNIRYVTHYGDVVNHGDRLAEWNNADIAMRTLDLAGVPQGMLAGNHDITPSGVAGSAFIPGNYLAYFGPQRYAGKPWFRGASPSGLATWQVFTGAGQEFLGLSIVADAPLAELAWAQEILDANRDKVAILTTHRYLQDAEDYTAGVPVVPSGRYPDVWYGFEGLYHPQGLRSEQIWDWFVRRNPNIALVLCGHFHEEYRQQSTNVRGLPVHEVLADYQDDPNGGDGWLRLHTFDLANNRIDVETYSTYLDQHRTADESRFSLPVQFAEYRSADPVRAFQQGISGYTGTQDTWLDQSSPNTSYGEAGVRVSDDDVANSLFSDQRGQALLRFDGIVGTGANQIPPGAQIVSAHLTIQIADDIDTPLFNPDFLVHRMLAPWSEASTWNSLGSGVGGAEIGPLLARFSGDNNPNEDGLRRIDVAAAVRDWVAGAPNFGFAIRPDIIAGHDDGIEILTSESSNPLLRPRLEVVWREQATGVAYCFGDGSSMACPCGNTSWSGAQAGCLNSLGGAATLRAQGTASLAADSLVLRGAAMPDSSALYFQGTASANALFGDGLRCAAGSVRRLGAKTNSGGASIHPAIGDAPISVTGAIAAPGDRYYQVWYRNAAAFCGPDTFNLSNGLRVTWTP
jgi:hypothetical protein